MAGLDITPAAAPGRQVIQAYGEGRFRIAGQVHAGSVLVLPDRTVAWAVTAADGVTLDSLAEATAAEPPTEILLVGCGPRYAAVPEGLATDLQDAGVALEWMDTGAACRTFNVLLLEDRRVAAALIAIP